MKKNRHMCAMGVAFLASAIALCSLLSGSLPAFANSAQTSWRGVSSSGALIIDGQCPVEVEAEYLTFNISSFPASYYDNVEQLLEYDGCVTAEYHLYNPADYEVTVNLAFPFGLLPDYYVPYYGADDEVDMWCYDHNILVDGERVGSTLRHTYSYGYDYDNETDKSRLRDDYLSEGLFSPRAIVTSYVYMPYFSSGYSAVATASFPEFDETKTALLCSASGMDGRERRFSQYCYSGNAFVVYTIGEPIDPMVWSIEGGSCQLVETFPCTLEELIMQNYDEEGIVSKVDWFNAVCDRIMLSRRTVINDFIYYDAASFTLPYTSLLRWYEYSVTIPAGGRAVNSVTAPVYPSIKLNSPSYYIYTYLLSPAGDWAGFSNLTITINTPYYLSGCVFEGFEKVDGGYIFTSESLPSGELKFVLSASPDLQIYFSNGSIHDPYANLGIYIVVGICVVVIAGLVVWLTICRLRRRRRR